ncbi:hypothetical protein C8Q76DRAFT_147606 [Earliella scabrosa]|nr:hypothetical protein C8Q76DRAFT_147606 [Earliella scabrosa]
MRRHTFKYAANATLGRSLPCHGCGSIIQGSRLYTNRPAHPSIANKPALFSIPRSKPVTVRTLHRKWLSPDDHIDLSDCRGVIVDPSSHQSPDPILLARENTDAAYVSYARQERLTVDGTHRLLTYSPFPVNTRGFLYLNKHPKIPMASSLRFRLTQNPDPRSFAQGIDLQTDYGTPWQIPLLALATQPRFFFFFFFLRSSFIALEGYALW